MASNAWSASTDRASVGLAARLTSNPADPSAPPTTSRAPRDPRGGLGGGPPPPPLGEREPRNRRSVPEHLLSPAGVMHPCRVQRQPIEHRNRRNPPGLTRRGHQHRVLEGP